MHSILNKTFATIAWSLITATASFAQTQQTTANANMSTPDAVSYTHLTLPTT
jgi:hypothetical protein